MLIKDLIDEKKKDIEFAEAFDQEGSKLKTDIEVESSSGCEIDILVKQALIEYDSVFKELVNR
jgi:hypothetical protein